MRYLVANPQYGTSEVYSSRNPFFQNKLLGLGCDNRYSNTHKKEEKHTHTSTETSAMSARFFTKKRSSGAKRRHAVRGTASRRATQEVPREVRVHALGRVAATGPKPDPVLRQILKKEGRAQGGGATCGGVSGWHRNKGNSPRVCFSFCSFWLKPLPTANEEMELCV